MAERSTIAVVDDDPSARAAIASLLAALGHRASLFESAHSFLAKRPWWKSTSATASSRRAAARSARCFRELPKGALV